MPATSERIVRAEGLSKVFKSRRLLGGRTEPVHAVKNVNLEIGTGEIVGLAGESGSGKSTLASILAGLEEPTDGVALYGDHSIHQLKGDALKRFQRDVQFVFQDPFDALTGRFTIEECIEEPLVVQKLARRSQNRAKVMEAMASVGLTPPEEYLAKRPWQLSGGQRQRVAIARALIMDPTIIIADEPVSMLDVSLRAGVLEILGRLRDQLNVSVLYISHDLSTIRQICDRVLIMLEGEVVERGSTRSVLQNPSHPYTRSLLDAAPRLSGTFLRAGS